MSNPTPEGIFSLSSVCIRGRDVTERDPFKNLKGPIKESADLQKVSRQSFRFFNREQRSGISPARGRNVHVYEVRPNPRSP